MADGFEVEVDTLRALSRQLTSIGQTVSGAREGMDGLGAGQTGDAELASAVRHFSDDWEYSLAKIGETARAVAERTTAAADGYRQTDAAVADAAVGRT